MNPAAAISASALIAAVTVAHSYVDTLNLMTVKEGLGQKIVF